MTVMLSNDEEHELNLLERSLRDSAWRRFLSMLAEPLWRHRWKIRAAFAFGVLVTVCGVVTASDEVFNEGVLVTGVVVGYWVIMFLRSDPGPPPRNGPGSARRLPGDRGW